MTDKKINMGIVNDEKIPSSAPPVTNTGIIGWMKENLFNGFFNSLLTIVTIFFLYLTVPGILDWTIFSAVWGGDADTCKANPNGACWPFVAYRWEQFLYGQYPFSQRWRIDLGLWWLAIGITFLVFSLNAREKGGLKMFLAGFVLALGLLFTYLIRIHEGSWVPVIIGWAMVAFWAYLYWMKPKLPVKNILGIFMLVVYPIICFFLLSGGSWTDFIFIFLKILAVIGVFYFLISRVWPQVNSKLSEPLNLLVNVVVTLLALWLTLKVMGFLQAGLNEVISGGLNKVGTNRWGGFTLTLVIALTGIVASLPLGIVLALGRRSTMPVIRLLSTLFIELWRAVPLITVLFMASVMFPLFVPPEATIDQLLRALIGVSLFSAAYMAEVIRGGLQAIPKGQYEGAMALGLPYWKMMGLVVMPQALKIVIPGIVNTFIGLFKDTTLVLIIGLMDFLNTVQSSMSDPNWLVHSVPYTAYIFVAAVFWVCCYGMARYSRYLEEKLHTGHKR